MRRVHQVLDWFKSLLWGPSPGELIRKSVGFESTRGGSRNGASERVSEREGVRARVTELVHRHLRLEHEFPSTVCRSPNTVGSRQASRVSGGAYLQTAASPWPPSIRAPPPRPRLRRPRCAGSAVRHRRPHPPPPPPSAASRRGNLQRGGRDRDIPITRTTYVKLVVAAVLDRLIEGSS